MTSLLKPEARRALLKEAGYSDQFIEEFEQGENQKEKLELLRDVIETLQMTGSAEEAMRHDRANGYEAPEKKKWPTFGD